MFAQETQCVPSGTVSFTYYPAGQASNVTSVAGTTAYGIDAADRTTNIDGPEGEFGVIYNPDNGLSMDPLFAQ